MRHAQLPRFIPWILLASLSLALAACRSVGGGQASQPPLAQNFNRDTVQTYDLQSGEFQQQPPFGARADRSQ